VTTEDSGPSISGPWRWALFALALAGAIVFYVLTIPRTVPASALPDRTPDLANGEYMFNAGGCASCHAEPAVKCRDPKIKHARLLGGGRCMRTDFGIFYVPNISPDKDSGIGTWTTLDFINAMKRGIGPGGAHLYPAFPYASYQRMTYEDLIDLKAYLDTLPAVKKASAPHDLTVPYNWRRVVGLWQLLYVDGETFKPDADKSAEINRGKYLVEGPGHCGECHTPRNDIGGLIASQAFAGAHNPEGKGKIPNITPSKDGVGDWSEEELVDFFTTGHTPDFDVVGGRMAQVQENLAKLSAEDRAAIAAYLKSLPPLPDAVPRRGKDEHDEDAAGDEADDAAAETPEEPAP
jgi:mono/diheme cytochrome c family protein